MKKAKVGVLFLGLLFIGSGCAAVEVEKEVGDMDSNKPVVEQKVEDTVSEKPSEGSAQTSLTIE
mgnify:CR=1 FL=1